MRRHRRIFYDNKHIKSESKTDFEAPEKAKARAQEGVFLVEGLRMVREVPRKRVIEVYASESFFERHGDILEGLKRITEVVSDKVFEHMSDTKTPQGVLAVVKRQEYLLEEMLKEKEGKNPFSSSLTICRIREILGLLCGQQKGQE